MILLGDFHGELNDFYPKIQLWLNPVSFRTTGWVRLSHLLSRQRRPAGTERVAQAQFDDE